MKTVRRWGEVIFIHVVNPFGPRFEAVGTVFAHVDNGAFVHPSHMFLQAGSAGVTKKSRAIVLTRHMSVQSAKSLENSSTVLA